MPAITVNTAPMGAVRMTQRSKWAPAAQRYLQHKVEIGWAARQIIRQPLAGPIRVQMTFIMPVPASWSKKQKVAALAGQVAVSSKPDLDNMVKAVFDGLNGIAWQDDKQVIEESSRKVYGEHPRIEIIVEAAA